MPSDYDALPALMDVMGACGFHDLDRALSSLDRAEAALGSRFHQSRASVHAARDAAQQGHWRLCWTKAHQSTHTLTGPLPPDISVCAPMPDDQRAFTTSDCACGATLSAGVRFCAHCGTPVTT